MGEEVTKSEYESHKAKCGKSFEDVFNQLDKLQAGQNKLDRAMFGEKDLGNKGVVDMTKEMYQTIMYARGGEKIFITVVKIAGFIVTVSAAFWAIVEFIKRVKLQ